MPQNLANRLLFEGASQVGAPGQNTLSVNQQMVSGPRADQTQATGLLQRQREEDERQKQQQQQSNNYRRPQQQQAQPTSTASTGTTAAPQGGALVGGDIGSAVYAPSYGLGTSTAGLSYGGATGAATLAPGATATGLGAASTGAAYGGATGAATLGTGATGWGSLAGASTGLTYGSAIGGSAATGAATSGVAASGASAGAASAGGAAASGAGAAGGASALGSLGPWGALAAVIVANESAQKKSGNRREGTQYWKDLFGGKVFEQDMNKYADKWDKDNKIGLNGDMKFIGNLNTLDFGNAAKEMKNTTGIKWLKKLF